MVSPSRWYKQRKSLSEKTPRSPVSRSFQMFPNAVAGEKEDGFRMVDDVVHIIGIEILQDGHYDAAVGDGGHICNAPAGVVFADNRYFVAAAQAAMLE